MNYGNNENVIEWLTGQDTVGVTLTQKKYINKVEKLAQKYGDKVTILARNEDGSIFARLPLSAVCLSVKTTKLTDEQKKERASRLKSARKEHAATHGSKAEVIVRNDLLHVYGNLVLALHARGWKREIIENLLVTIQKYWVQECEDVERRYDAGLEVEKIADKVKRITGVELQQMVQDVINIEV